MTNYDTAADDTVPYRIYRSDSTTLIRVGASEIELSTEDTAKLANELNPPQPLTSPTGRIKWTQELKDRVRRLYVDKGWGAARIARDIGTRRTPVQIQISMMKLPPHNPQRGAAALAARRARVA